VEREDWNRRWQERELHVRADESRVLVQEVDGLTPGRALDLACGAGRNAIWLAERGWRVTGVDFSDVALAQARRAARERGVAVDWVDADVRTFEPEPGAFDLVLVFFLHLPPEERSAVLARAAAALAPGGTLLVTGHDLANLGTGAPGPSNPLVLYTADDVAAELADLTIEKAERVTRTVESDAGEVTAVDSLVRASRSA
jgi:2-polyprenyl-3-methyl-5-hydroxy-6-metoxy-1,4-benzoquinol methylase